MKKTALVFLFLAGLAIVAPVAAQPAPVAPEGAVAPVAAQPAPVAPEGALEVTSEVAPVAAQPAPVAPEGAVAKPTPEWKTAGFWISKVLIPILLFVIALLAALGVVKQSWAQWARDKGIITVADKVVTAFEAYAHKTPAKWDDILAQALKAVVVRFGELAPEEMAKVEAIVKERQEQAEKKNGMGSNP